MINTAGGKKIRVDNYEDADCSKIDMLSKSNVAIHWPDR